MPLDQPASSRDWLIVLNALLQMRRTGGACGLRWLARSDGEWVTLYPVRQADEAIFSSFSAPPEDIAGRRLRLSVSTDRIVAATGLVGVWANARVRAAFNRIARAHSRRLLPYLLDALIPPDEGLVQGSAKAARRRFLMTLSARAPALSSWMRRVGAQSERRAARLRVAPSQSFEAPTGPKNRSALFVHSAYYNFGYLAAALRARGWDAVSVSTADPDGYPAMYTHGHDMVLHDPERARANGMIAAFVEANLDRFGVVHFYGVGASGLFYENWDNTPAHDRMPWDLLEWKRRGALIGYSTTGCLDMVSQSAFRQWSGDMCGVCPWEAAPTICSDAKNLAWGAKIAALADVIAVEADVRLDFRRGPNVFHEPLTFALDLEVWRPDLPIPDEFRQEREPGEVLVYHGVGNFEARQREGRNVKGTQAVLAAIATLQAEGLPVRLMFTREVPNLQNRYYEAQADIIVDQLNYGRYGATAREGMMLGKPVVGAVNLREPYGEVSRCMAEAPIVHATEESITAVLRDLVTDPAKRARLGAESRAYAIRWWSADVLAARFERLYDHVRATGRVPSFEEVG